VRALREGLGDSQQAFADRIGTRQQTVSEWERGASRPRRMAQRLLTKLAEEAASYTTARDTDEAPESRP
jgi:DNA-binding transcriptional regulator YiaG